MTQSRLRLWLSVGGAFVGAAILTVVAFNLSTAESHDTDTSGPIEEPVTVELPEPVAPEGPVTGEEYRAVLEARVDCANGLLGGDVVGLVADRNGQTFNVTYDVTDRAYADLENALNECTTPEGLGIEQAWLADTILTPEDFPQALAQVQDCAEDRGVAMPTDIAQAILSTTGEAQAEAIFDLLEALSGTPAEPCWDQAGFGSFST